MSHISPFFHFFNLFFLLGVKKAFSTNIVRQGGLNGTQETLSAVFVSHCILFPVYHNLAEI